MTAFDPRGAACAAAAALSLVGGLGACTASPRYPVLEGEKPGAGIEPLQPRYPITLGQATQAAAPGQSLPADTRPPSAAPEVAPRAAPTGDVSSTELPPPSGSATLDTTTTLSLTAPPAERSDEPPPSEPPPSGPNRSSETAAPPPASPFATVAGLGPPRTTEPGRPVAASTARAFLQRDGNGPERFTIGAPVPPPSVVAAPGPTAPLVYARPNAGAAPPTANASGSAAPSLASTRSGPASAAGRASTTKPFASSASPNGLPGGPRPYTSLFPQRPSSARGVRSAGIRSTPSNPGIAPQALSETPDAPVTVASGDAAARGRGRFLWPVKGALISAFGDKGGGVRNDGLNISANLGDPVRAAAAGEVVYAGNQVPGSGNLVLVKHSGGWVTEYAHLSRIEVRNRDPVAQGQELGQAGQTGAVDRPQLHFEIRYAPSPEVKAVPVDPTALLPAG